LFKQFALLQLTLRDLSRWLAFENAKEAAVFCDHFGLRLSDLNTEVVLCKDTLHNPSHQLPVGRAVSLIEMKRTCSVGEVSVEISHERFVQLLCHVICGLRVPNFMWVIGGKALPGEVSLDSSSYLRI
jgi:hypothetical protein